MKKETPEDQKRIRAPRVPGNQDIVKEAAEAILANIKFTEEEKAVISQPAVYKIFYNGRYFIHRGKTFNGSIFLFIKSYIYFSDNNYKSTENRGDLFYKMFTYMKRNPDYELKIKLIKSSTDAVELLRIEFEELQKCFSDKKNMNANIEPYIPPYNEAKKIHGGWLTPEDVAQFKSWQAAQ